MTSCKTSDDASGLTDTERQSIEKTTGYVCASAIDASAKVFGVSSILLVGAADRSEYEISEPAGYSYDSSTGWWNFSLSLSNNQTAVVNVKLLDSGGNFHKYFSSSITQITSNGQGNGPNGSFTYNFTFTGVQSGSGSYVANGSGTATYLGTSASYTVTNMTFTKNQDDIPESGTLSVTALSSTVSVTFNGSSRVSVTYSHNGRSYTFNINLLTGAV